MNSFGVMLIALLLFLPLVVGTWLFIRAYSYHQSQDAADRAVERFRRATRFKYDALGNPELFFNPKTGDIFAPAPGNKAIAEQYILYNGNPKKATEDTPERPIIVYANRPIQKEEISPIQPNQDYTELPQAAEFKELPAAQRIYTDEEIKAELYRLKQEGRVGKEQAIKQTLGITTKNRASSLYKTYSAVWDNLRVEEGANNQ